MSEPSLLISLLLSGWQASLGAPVRCYLAADARPGWKRVAIPDDSPALSAPDGVDQLRGGEPALLARDDLDALAEETPLGWGRTGLRFKVDPLATRWLQVTMLEPLQGAKVDVFGVRDGRRLSLRRAQREGGRTVELGWSEPFEAIQIVVHHHLRTRPVVRAVESGAVAREGSGDPPPGFRLPGYLYFRNPGGQRLRLCNREDAVLRYHLGYWDAPADLTALLPAR